MSGQPSPATGSFRTTRDHWDWAEGSTSLFTRMSRGYRPLSTSRSLSPKAASLTARAAAAAAGVVRCSARTRPGAESGGVATEAAACLWMTATTFGSVTYMPKPDLQQMVYGTGPETMGP